MASSSAVISTGNLPAAKPGLMAYAQLVRLPNVFTAVSNICLGALVTGALPTYWFQFGCLVLASSCLYCAGMVWNDYFDFEQDKKERSFRPLPSGRITRSQAAWLGLFLLAAGVAFATIADWREEGLRWHSLQLALWLMAAILLYDAWWKRTWMGPFGMGACRFLNVLLGLSIAMERPAFWGILLALVVGVYVAGVTWFARTEARLSNQNILRAAACVMAGGLAISLFVPPLYEDQGTQARTFFLFPYLLVLFAFYVGLTVARAIRHPVPAKVQAAVKRAVLGLIVLDALLACSLIGPSGLLLVLLLVPAGTLGRWIYST